MGIVHVTDGSAVILEVDEGSTLADKLTKESLDSDIGPFIAVSYTEVKPQVNAHLQSYIHEKGEMRFRTNTCIIVTSGYQPPPYGFFIGFQLSRWSWKYHSFACGNLALSKRNA